MVNVPSFSRSMLPPGLAEPLGLDRAKLVQVELERALNGDPA